MPGFLFDGKVSVMIGDWICCSYKVYSTYFATVYCVENNYFEKKNQNIAVSCQTIRIDEKETIKWYHSFQYLAIAIDSVCYVDILVCAKNRILYWNSENQSVPIFNLPSIDSLWNNRKLIKKILYRPEFGSVGVFYSQQCIIIQLSHL